MKRATRLKRLAEQAEHQPLLPMQHAGPGRGHTTKKPRGTQGGNSRAYLLRRLARDRPDLLERLKKGEFATVRDAAREAGIVKDGRRREPPAQPAERRDGFISYDINLDHAGGRRKDKAMRKLTPTAETYTEFDRVYAYFNRTLFAGKLPPCVITMQRHRKAYGYFHGNTWADAKGELITDEIALNPDRFRGRSTADTLSTLVHEMCHLQQHHFGKPSRHSYHNKAWAAMMEAVGLVPSDTGAAGGKRTGQKVSHYIQQDGPFARACQALLAEGFTIPWVALISGDEAVRKKKAASKTKYACPDCGLNAWAKPDVSLLCGDCETLLLAEA